MKLRIIFSLTPEYKKNTYIILSLINLEAKTHFSHTSSSPSCASVCRPCCSTLVWSTFPITTLLSLVTGMKIHPGRSRSSVFWLSLLQAVMLSCTCRLPQLLVHLSNSTWDFLVEIIWIHATAWYESTMVWISMKYLVYCYVRAQKWKGIFRFFCGGKQFWLCVRFLHLNLVTSV